MKLHKKSLKNMGLALMGAALVALGNVQTSLAVTSLSIDIKVSINATKATRTSVNAEGTGGGAPAIAFSSGFCDDRCCALDRRSPAFFARHPHQHSR